MKKVRGLVLESTEERVFLLTPEGEYLELPGNGEVFNTGAEIELELPAEKKRNRFLPAFAAAALSLVFAFCLAFYSALYRPEAYLALDINPSIYFSLNGEGQVIKADPLNEEAHEILKGLQLQGQNIREALTLILDGAYAGNYLSAEKENVILISLAAPEGFIVSEDDLRTLVSERILSMEVNTYLKVATLEPQKAIEAREEDMPVNVLVLGEQMLEKGLIEEDEENSPGEERPADYKPQKPFAKKEPGLPPAVRELLSKVRLEEIFEPEEYIRGRKLEEKSQRSGLKEGALQANEKQEAKARHGGQEGEATERSEWEVETPQRVAPQGRTPGPPREGVPPGQAGRDLKPAEEDKPIPGAGKGTVIPPGREKEAITPSGQDKEGFTPPGREKGTFVPPGQDKELFIPPGRDKKTFVPPGRSKEGFVSPGLLNSSSTYSGWMKDKKIAPRLDNLKDRLILSESKGKGAEKNNSTKNNSTGKEKSKDSSRKGPSRRER
ncbi:MAG TPA: hypothetical protein GX004_00970 [Firmicutes bacterium]|nr:hypothetical protein [Bacillota bacterium]